jgi:hypothetical protein
VNLFKIRLTYPLVGRGRMQQQAVYLAMAADSDAALAALRRECLKAFEHQPEVSVEPYAGATLHLFTTAVPAPKASEPRS